MSEDSKTNTTNKPFTFIFIGRSGCGKGTQAELLKKYLEEKFSSHPVLMIETGDRFREFISGDSYASALSREVSEKGGLQPEFLAVYMWSSEFLTKLTGSEHLIIDGSPRRLKEAMSLETALSFFKRGLNYVLHIEVSPEWSRERLAGRKRSDDVRAGDVEKRLKWFDEEVIPVIDWMRSQENFKVFNINGEHTIEEVHNEIIRAVFNDND